jgi:NADPH:quinone reductase-like Zn-dependent oxidoreductase
MRSLVAPTYCKPIGYEVRDMPTPAIQKPGDVLVKVHASSLITGDTQLANGMFRFFVKSEYVGAFKF